MCDKHVVEAEFWHVAARVNNVIDAFVNELLTEQTAKYCCSSHNLSAVLCLC